MPEACFSICSCSLLLGLLFSGCGCCCSDKVACCGGGGGGASAGRHPLQFVRQLPPVLVFELRVHAAQFRHRHRSRPEQIVPELVVWSLHPSTARGCWPQMRARAVLVRGFHQGPGGGAAQTAYSAAEHVRAFRKAAASVEMSSQRGTSWPPAVAGDVFGRVGRKAWWFHCDLPPHLKSGSEQRS